MNATQTLSEFEDTVSRLRRSRVLLERATMTECIQKCGRCVTVHLKMTSPVAARAVNFQLAVGRPIHAVHLFLKATLRFALWFILFYIYFYFVSVFTWCIFSQLLYIINSWGAGDACHRHNYAGTQCAYPVAHTAHPHASLEYSSLVLFLHCSGVAKPHRKATQNEGVRTLTNDGGQWFASQLGVTWETKVRKPKIILHLLKSNHVFANYISVFIDANDCM